MLTLLTRPLGRVLAAGVVVILAALLWFILQIYPIGGSGALVIVTVHQGDSIATIANEMHAEGVIGSTLAFRIDTMLFGSLQVQSGSYQIAKNSSFAHVKAIFGAPPNVRVVAVTPGLTLHEVALQILSAKGTSFADAFVGDALAAAKTSPYRPNDSLEGLLGIGTYVIRPTDTPSSLVQRMMTSFAKEAASVGLTPSTTINGLSAYQLIIAASIVEKEGYYAVNMPQVARVIFNRLQRGQMLQMDSTVCYPLNLDPCPATVALEQSNSLYSTYKIPGLTPTPICSVSTVALNAVLHAPPGSWLYFVLIKRDGTMAFASTYKKQLENEALARRNGVG
ncbi:MAG TPA: endolytic transglycosylase MltG [Acidimicrobiales bacterium]